ncbi:MAG: bifunctional UDP-N-acetylmuramoyl-L-alanyl-D-glutamate--2,6-diaminopimelate ligase MurE/UDP-N-acetylmuramoyl-tripeptide--D-alanyl-D-alanine ligase MurF [Burkholderiaceae bacterium]|nr:bifunctional UDP-N-acetylmuramoyl-L-alanyl-D-glutamate--2,6-diaminopimelate ligase MurE/UDP-N-acetylmuramoyl-tripeptide--D-alanyl-D-alanine ligase MurF [Burkholderiaceae bacterium]
MSSALNTVDAVLRAVCDLGVPPSVPWSTDTRRLRAGDVFVAWPGAARDPRQFVAQALAANASAVLIEAEGAQHFGFSDARIVAVEGLKALAGPLAAAWYGHPSRAVRLLAITGTNGKTSCALWTAQAMNAAGQRCGVIGTLGAGWPDALQSTGFTTPDPVHLQAELATLRAQGAGWCAIEASSIGLTEYRLDGCAIHAAAFTNLTQDHLDYHGDMTAYAQAKQRLFAWPGLRRAVLNLDDAFAANTLLADCRARGLDVQTTALQTTADWQAEDLVQTAASQRLTLVHHNVRHALDCPVLGAFNLSNLLLVAALLHTAGLDDAQVLAALRTVRPAPGRMQMLGGQDAPLAVIDYAHTPDALDKALQALRPVATARKGKLWCVFGAGGDRDARKRPLMAQAAEHYADRVVLTSDNPRSEASGAILQDLLAGLQQPAQVLLMEDRAEAIAQTLAHASTHDVVLIAGKGHESTQEIAGRKLAFHDGFHARMALEARGAGLFSLAEAQGWIGAGAQVIGDAQTAARSVQTDSRKLTSGALFVALRGERFDAHDFLPQAAAAGAAALLAEHGVAASGLPGIEVADTRRALGLLARGWRRQQALPLIAVTGSNGKTTVTQMLAAILAAWQGEDGRLATQGNFNNDVGLPLTLLRLRPQHQAAVVELGMNHPGEIAWLASLAEPTVALVNNAQREHQEFMHSVEAVARENGAVLSALPQQGVAVFPADDAQTAIWAGLAQSRRTLRFALRESGAVACDAEVSGLAFYQQGQLRVQLHTPAGHAEVGLQLLGRHNARNALAATAAALAAGAPLDAICRALEAFAPVTGRLVPRRLQWPGARPLLLIDDSYNANPDSVRAAIDVLAELAGRNLLILGDMGEVGDNGPAFHAEIGAYAAQRGLAALWTCGDLTAHAAAAARTEGLPEVRHAAGLADLPLQADLLRGFDTVLVKGSRFMRMERAVQTIAALAANGHGAQEPEAHHAA